MAAVPGLRREREGMSHRPPTKRGRKAAWMVAEVVISFAASDVSPLRHELEVRFAMARRLFSFLFPRVFCALTALFSVVVAGAPAWGQFETRASNPLPYGAFSIATGDFNHDGKLDIAVVDDNGFSVSLGNGDGTFGKPVSYSNTGFSIAAGDFNNDGNIDLVTANGYNSVSVYLGNGDGTFQSPKTTTTAEYCSFVAVGDFNGDGKLDVVIIDSPYISVLLGNGDGTFQAPSDNNSFVGGHELAVGDFNNDHRLDVVVEGFFGGSYNIGVLLGNGDGTLQPSLTYPLPYVPAGVAVGDFNRDGNLDAVVGYDLDGVAVLLGKGDGSFQPEVIYNTTGLGGGQMVVSDLNLDGKLDLMAPSGSGVDVFWGNGDGTLRPAQFFGSGVSGLPAVGDLNGDGLPDFVFANEFAAVTMLNTGVVSFSPTAPLVFPVQLINTTSAPKAVTLTNNGTTTLSISTIKVSGQFQVSNTCGSSVVVGANCSISAVFDPKAAGTLKGLITLLDSASSKPQVIELSGRATAVKLSAASLNFGSQKVGTKSAPQVVTATNESSTAVYFKSVGIGGADGNDFEQTENCTGGAIQPGASCKVTVTFAPTRTGARTGTLYINVQGGISPQPVTLAGTGT